MLETVKLQVSVHNAVKPLVPTTFIRLEPAWENINTCALLLERTLRENGHEAIADQLDNCEVVFKCFGTIGVQNAFGSKRSRTTEEMIATTFFMDLLGGTLPEIELDELLFNITTPTPTRHAPAIDATALLMRQSLSTSLLPPKKQFPNMNGDQNSYNVVLNYVEGQGIGWTPQHLDSSKEFLKHSTSAFWSLNEKVRCASCHFS
jgi:hypothetical protein